MSTPTAGRLHVRVEPHGTAVVTMQGLTVGWFGTGIVTGKGGTHVITKSEAEANARLFVRAHTAQAKETP